MNTLLIFAIIERTIANARFEGFSGVKTLHRPVVGNGEYPLVCPQRKVITEPALYSARSASIGWTEAARVAGMRHATIAAATSTRATERKTEMSNLPTP